MILPTLTANQSISQAWESEQLKRFAQFWERLISCSDVTQILETSAKELLESATADEVSIYWRDAEDEVYRLQCAFTADGSVLTDESWEQLSGINRLLGQLSQPLVITGAEPDDRLRLGMFLSQRGVCAMVALPLLSKTAPYARGFLMLRYQKIHSSNDIEQQLLMLYAARMMGAVERITMLDDYRQRDMDLHIVVDTVHMINSTLALNDLLQQVAVRMTWVGGMDDCLIASYNDDPDRFTVLAFYNAFGKPNSEYFGREYLLEDYPLTRDALEQGKSVHLRCDDLLDGAGEQSWICQGKYVSMIIVPLRVAGKTIGLINLFTRNEHAQLSALSTRRLQLLAEQVAMAMVNARLYQSECEQRAVAEAMREISLALSSSLDTPDILKVLLEQIATVVPYDSACVLLVEGEIVRVAAQSGYNSWTEKLPLTFPIKYENVPNLQTLADQRRSHVIADVIHDDGWIHIEDSHIRSWVGAPLIVRDRLLGFLSLDHTQANFYNQEHADRLETMASHAAVALWNALAYSEVEHESITDFLTGIYNHRYFQHQLRLEFDQAVKNQQTLALLMIDIDHFKKINDTYGHRTGDFILRLMTTRLRKEMRSVDLFARYGGEEFAILLPNLADEDLEKVGSRLLKAISDEEFQVEGVGLSLTISIGGAIYPQQAQNPVELIAIADQALYQAKHQGRNCLFLGPVLEG